MPISELGNDPPLPENLPSPYRLAQGTSVLFSAVPIGSGHDTKTVVRSFRSVMSHGLPVVIGVTIPSYGNEGKFAILLEATENTTHISDIRLGFELSARIVGSLWPLAIYNSVGLHEIINEKFDQRKPWEGQFVYEDGSGVGGNAYHHAARFIDANSELLKKPMKEFEDEMAIMKESSARISPLELLAKQTVLYNGKEISLPHGMYYIASTGSLLLFGLEEGGDRKIVMMDELANRLDDAESTELFDLMEDQAGVLEALAMTYRLVAMAGKIDDEKPDDDTNWLM